MGARLGKLKSAMANFEKVLNELKDKGAGAINEPETAYVQKVEQIVTKGWESLDNKWEELEDDNENFKKEDQCQKCENNYKEGEEAYNAILDSTRQVLQWCALVLEFTRF